MRELSGWQHVTGVPKSAKQAEITVPRYPAPYTPICINPPRFGNSGPVVSFIYAVCRRIGRVRKGHVPWEKVHVMDNNRYRRCRFCSITWVFTGLRCLESARL